MPQQGEFPSVFCHLAPQLLQMIEGFFRSISPVPGQGNIHGDQGFFAQGQGLAGMYLEHREFAADPAAKAFCFGVAERTVPVHTGIRPALPGIRRRETKVMLPAAAYRLRRNGL